MPHKMQSPSTGGSSLLFRYGSTSSGTFVGQPLCRNFNTTDRTGSAFVAPASIAEPSGRESICAMLNTLGSDGLPTGVVSEVGRRDSASAFPCACVGLKQVV